MEDSHCWQSKFVSCPYSDNLINKIISLNKTTSCAVDVNEIKKAIYYAKKYHGNQKRDSGEPYYTHPLAVAEMVADFCFKTDILVTSVLHDTAEDTALTTVMIDHIFGTIVATQVEALTRIKVNQKRKISVAELVDSLWKQKKYNILFVKFFDRFHNMQSIHVKSTKKINSTTIETLKTFTSLSMFLQSLVPELHLAGEELTSLCIQNLNFNKLDKNIFKPIFFEDNFQLPFLDFQNDIYRN